VYDAGIRKRPILRKGFALILLTSSEVTCKSRIQRTLMVIVSIDLLNNYGFDLP
jgi:hypothetical protein